MVRWCFFWYYVVWYTGVSSDILLDACWCFFWYFVGWHAGVCSDIMLNGTLVFVLILYWIVRWCLFWYYVGCYACVCSDILLVSTLVFVMILYWMARWCLCQYCVHRHINIVLDGTLFVPVLCWKAHCWLFQYCAVRYVGVCANILPDGMLVIVPVLCCKVHWCCVSIVLDGMLVIVPMCLATCLFFLIWLSDVCSGAENIHLFYSVGGKFFAELLKHFHQYFISTFERTHDFGKICNSRVVYLA